MNMLRIWFLMGLPLAMFMPEGVVSETVLGPLWLLAAGLPLASMALLRPAWLLRWLLWPMMCLWHTLGSCVRPLQRD